VSACGRSFSVDDEVAAVLRMVRFAKHTLAARARMWKHQRLPQKYSSLDQWHNYLEVEITPNHEHVKQQVNRVILDVFMS
jgi:hypothetical protein